ncbi:epidermal growth factor receptor substrate 15-like 1 [Anabrus simplex]|uniref:epidermal growth factor receptor substrate 15-like 1 n=1 Tax=Anabrus simplex TaxID=316456 RepID=UPI0034DCD953
MSESERFERSFQPNVALAPIPRQRSDTVPTKSEVKTEVVQSEVDIKSPCPSVSEKLPVPASISPNITPPPILPSDPRNVAPHYNPEIELSTDTDDSSSDAAVEPAPESELAAVLEALRETSGETRARVMSLVQDLLARYHRLQEENSELRQLNQEHERRISELERRLEEQESPIKQDPDAFEDKMEKMEKELRTLREMVGHRKQESRTSSVGSPVSVITSPPPVVIKSEPMCSE